MSDVFMELLKKKAAHIEKKTTSSMKMAKNWGRNMSEQ